MTDSDDNAADEADFTETNLDPYLKRRHKLKFSQRPWCAYFFYFGPSKDGKRRFERYFYPSLHGPIKRKHLRDLITQLALNARLPYAKQNPQPFDSDAKNVWTRKSYMIALVDDPTFKFDDKAIKIGESGGGKPNHTFFDAKNFDDIRLPDPDRPNRYQYVHAVCVVNHMKKASEEDIPDGEEENFMFSFHPDPAGRGAMETDDGGKNLGPPAPPPA